MNVLITYKEISDFIEQKFKIRPLFSSIDRRTLNVSYKLMAFMPSIDIKFVIDEISDDSYPSLMIVALLQL